MAENEKSKTVYTEVEMTDGRKVKFAGKRKVNKETVIDAAKVEQDGDLLQISAGAVSIRLDFRNGETRLIPLPLSLFPKFAGHGGEQKFGDELASPADKPLSEDDMVIAIDALDAIIQSGEWGRGRAEGGGGVSGAGIVVRAIMEATGKGADVVKAFLQKKLDADKDLTRRALYDSFRSPGTKTAAIIKRLEDEAEATRLSKASKIDAAGALGELEAA